MRATLPGSRSNSKKDAFIIHIDLKTAIDHAPVSVKGNFDAAGLFTFENEKRFGMGYGVEVEPLAFEYELFQDKTGPVQAVSQARCVFLLPTFPFLPLF
jgi:hypothetical protein